MDPHDVPPFGYSILSDGTGLGIDVVQEITGVGIP